MEIDIEEIKANKKLNIRNSAKFTIDNVDVMEYKPTYDSDGNPDGFNLFVY